MTETQAVLEEGLVLDTANPDQKHMLMDMLEGLPSRPHEWPNLAAKGYKQYKHIGKKLQATTDIHSKAITQQQTTHLPGSSG